MHPEDKKLAKLTRTQVKTLINRFAQFDIDQLEDVLKDKKRTVLEHMVGRIFLLGIKEGDYRRMDAMLDRMVGKVKEEVEVKMPTPYIVENIETGKSYQLGAADKPIDAEVIEDA